MLLNGTGYRHAALLLTPPNAQSIQAMKVTVPAPTCRELGLPRVQESLVATRSPVARTRNQGSCPPRDKGTIFFNKIWVCFLFKRSTWPGLSIKAHLESQSLSFHFLQWRPPRKKFRAAFLFLALQAWAITTLSSQLGFPHPEAHGSFITDVQFQDRSSTLKRSTQCGDFKTIPFATARSICQWHRPKLFLSSPITSNNQPIHAIGKL